MDPRGAFASSRVLATGPLVRRACVVAALVLAERLATPATAWLLFRATLAGKLAVTAVLGGLFTVGAFAQRLYAARTEADLFVRCADAVLSTDVLRPNVLPEDDARSELAQAIFHATQALSRDIPALGADLLASVVLTIGLFAVVSARIVGMAAGLTFVGLGALLVSRRTLEGAVARAWRAQRHLHEAFIDALDGRLEIVAAGRRAPFMADLQARGTAWGLAGARVAAGSIVSGRLPTIGVAAAVGALVLVAGAQWRAALSVSFSDVALLASVTPAVAGAAQGLILLANARKWLELVARVLAAPRVGHPGVRPAPERPARIAFEGVSFRYDESPSGLDALDDVSFELRGPVLALSGSNGSGKSTCLRLLLGLAAPRRGRILVDATPLEELAIDDWRSRVAYLPQRPYLPPRSDVGAAIRFLAPEASEATLLRALDQAGLLHTLRRMGASPLSVGVDALSVGQRQRVGLARLLCRPAGIYLLDEPDANLDREGIRLVGELVRELSSRAIVILAAHTKELLDVADEVVTLEAGRCLSSATVSEPRIA